MVIPNLLLKEKIINITDLHRAPEKILRGFVRLVSDRHGIKTAGFFFDTEAFASLLEALEYASPEFWDEIEESRNSGRVSSATVKKRLGLK